MLTRSFHLLITIVLVVPTLLLAFNGGNGSAVNPFQIATAAQLDSVRLYCGAVNSDKYFILINDIDLTSWLLPENPGYNDGAFWMPIGSNLNKFYGNFDGNGNKVSGIKIERPDSNYIGLFGCIGSGCVITNVGVEVVNGDSLTGKAYVGGLVGYNDTGTVNNSYAVVKISGYRFVGGLIGNNKGTVYTSFAKGSVTELVGESSGWIGGLAGSNSRIVGDCFAMCAVTGNAGIGGLLGNNGSYTQVLNCFATGPVIGGSNNVGGLIGLNMSGGQITNCYWDKETCRLDTSSGSNPSFGKTTEVMKMGFLSWDFSTIWRITGTRNGGYPSLRWQNIEIFSGGNGSEINPLRISTAIQLDSMRYCCGIADSALYFILINNINLSAFLSEGNPGFDNGAFWKPIGSISKKFLGKIDGDGYKIIDLKINRPDSNNIGLFGYIGGSSRISNLDIEIQSGGTVKGKNYVGGLVGCNDTGTINNCNASGTSVNGSYAGGLVGVNNGTVINSNTNIIIGDSLYIGGLVGSNNGIINNCFTIGQVDTRGYNPRYIGGVTGINYGTINNSHSTGMVKTNGNIPRYIGGLTGMNIGIIQDCFSSGEVSGYMDVGGLVGRNAPTTGYNKGTINNCYTTGTITGTKLIGGLIGSGGIIHNSYSTSLVNGNTDVGGLAGSVDSVRNSYASGSVVGNVCVGGLVGYSNGIVDSCYATGFVNGADTVGGLVGKVFTGIVRNSYWDIQTTGQNLSAGSESTFGKTTTQMTTQANYLGWSFENVWSIEKSKNYGYPYLQWQTVFIPSPPRLISPSHQSADVSITPELIWCKYDDDLNYTIQVSLSSVFSSLVINSSHSDTVFSIDPGILSNNTTYYWRVASTKNSGEVTNFSTVFSFTTIPGVPEAPILATPSDGATGLSVIQALKWNSVQSATTYRVQFSTSSDFSDVIFDDSTVTGATPYGCGELSGNTTYYWRVNAKNAIGTSEWSDVWSFTTAIESPEKPTLASPENSSPNQPLSTSLAWDASTGASTYRVQFSTSSNFSSTIIDDSTITSLTKTTGLLSTNTTYYWRVNAKNTGGTSEWSDIWSFSTIPPTAGVPIPSSPPNSAIDQSLNLSLSWGAVAEASTYRVQLSTAGNFSSTIIDDSTITSLSKTIESLSTKTTYYWRVNAKNVVGTSEWSEVWSFSTIPPTAGVPVLSSPLNSATDQSLNLTLSWNAATGASTYRVQLSTAGNFSSTIIDDSTVTSLSKTIESLNTNTTYYWRVNAKNAGGTSEWTKVWSFTTLPPPPKPVILISPLKKAINVTLDVNLNWQKSSDATKYYLQISTDSIFSSIVWLDSTLEDTNTTCDKLTNDAIYFWRVKAYNQGGTGEWSPFFQFTTIVSLPSLSTLLSPISRDSVGTDSVNLIWYSGTPDIDKYLVEYSNDSLFSNSNKDSTVTDTIKAITNLENNQIVFWHVKAHNVAGWGDWSNTFWFIVNIPPVNTVQKIPKVFSFSVNNSTKHFKYTLPQSENVSLLLYDLKGVLRAEIVNERQIAGFYTVSVPLHGLASGTYITVFTAGKFVSKKRSFYIR